MSKYNSNKVSVESSLKTVNHEGGEAFRQTAEMELYSAVVSSLLNDSFYEKADERLTRIENLMTQVDPLFVAQLAVYAREKMYLRSAPVMLAVKLAKIQAKNQNKSSLVSNLVSRIIQRADEISEILACYQKENERTGQKKLNKLSAQIKKGVGEAFHKFNEYQFAKYKKDSKDVSLKDALRLCHVKSKSIEEASLFKKINEGTLETPDTWEVMLSAAGSDPDKKRKVWESLISEKKLGYMGTIRNISNMIKADVSPEAINQICEHISDETAVKGSKQFPFRFLSAYRILHKDHRTHIYTKGLSKALEQAVKHSVSSIQGLNDNDRILIASDVSGSMQWYTIGGRNSIVTAYDVGLLLSMALRSRCNFVQSGFFGEIWKLVDLPSDNILHNVVELYKREGEVGYSTNGFKVIQWALDEKKAFDKIMIFTDCEMYGGSLSDLWWKYYDFMKGQTKLYLFNLAGYSTTPIKTESRNVYNISGYSDRIFEMMDSIEAGSSVIKEIKKIQI